MQSIEKSEPSLAAFIKFRPESLKVMVFRGALKWPLCGGARADCLRTWCHDQQLSLSIFDAEHDKHLAFLTNKLDLPVLTTT